MMVPSAVRVVGGGTIPSGSRFRQFLFGPQRVQIRPAALHSQCDWGAVEHVELRQQEQQGGPNRRRRSGGEAVERRDALEVAVAPEAAEERERSSPSCDGSDLGLLPRFPTGSCVGPVLTIGRRVFCQKQLDLVRR